MVFFSKTRRSKITEMIFLKIMNKKEVFWSSTILHDSFIARGFSCTINFLIKDEIVHNRTMEY